LRYRITPQAASQIVDATDWLWLNVGEAASARLSSEIETTIQSLLRHPSLGPPVVNAAQRGARRIQLPTQWYHLYYRVNEREDLLEVVALRHTRRGGKANV